MKPDVEKGKRFLAAKGARYPIVVGVTGAHYYGFPSPDSDLDLKGIHVAPTAEVVSLSPVAESIDAIEIFEGLEIDYTSHELGLALRLLLRGNGNMLERILSTFPLVETPESAWLQMLARGAVSRRFFHHYRGFFGRMVQDWRRSEPKTVKGLLYAYRSALTGIHLLETGECVGDVTQLAPRYGFERVPALVQQKAQGTEHGAVASADGFEEDFARLDARLVVAHQRCPLPEESPNRAELDGFLVEMRRRHFD
jgi:predicted nucleotidyltransferase